MNTLVSIVTPVYNSRYFLQQTIYGIQSQTFPGWELLLIDDGSTDGSDFIAEEHARNDDRITLIRLSGHFGPANARNVGIEKARGRYIAFCDSDDIWLPDKLERQLYALSHNDAAVCFSSYYKMLEDGVKTDRIVLAKPMITYDMLLCSNYIGCSTALYDTHRCGKVLMPDIIKRQDYGLWLRILSADHTAIGLPEPLVYYRVRAGSVSGNKIKAAYYHWKILRSATNVSFFFAIRLFAKYAWIGMRKHQL